MALMIATAGSGVSPGATVAEQPGSDNPAGSPSPAGDAFAGVLAGIGESGPRAGRPDVPGGRAGGKASAGSDASSDVPAAAELADLAVLALLAPALPASTVALIDSGYSAATEPPAGEPGTAGSSPVGGSAPGPAPQAAEPAQQAAARRPAPAVAAQAAASAAKAARLADGELPGPVAAPVHGPPAGHGPTQPTGPAEGSDPLAGTGPVEGPGAGHRRGPVTALGPARAADPAREAASAAIFELARAAQAAGGSAPTSSPSIPAEPGSPATAGTPSIATAGTSSIATAPGNPGTASTPPGAVTPGAATPADPSTPGTPPVTMPLPVSAVQPAVVTLPGTAAAVARTAGAAKAIDTAGTGAAKAAEVSTPSGSGVADGGLRTENLPATHAPNHRPARGPVSRTSAAEPAAVAAPATPGSGLVIDTASGATQAGIPTAQAGIAQPAIPAAQLAGGGQPVAAGPGSEQVHRYPATDLPLASQVAGPVLSLRARGDGSHQLIVALHPAELGPVNVHVRIEGDLMTIQLASTSETAHDTLRDALPQLRSELQAAGLSTASLSLDLSSGGPGGFAGSGAFADPRQAAGAPNQAARLVPAGDQNPVPPRHRTSGDRVGTQSSSGLDRWL